MVKWTVGLFNSKTSYLDSIIPTPYDIWGGHGDLSGAPVVGLPAAFNPAKRREFALHVGYKTVEKESKKESTRDFREIQPRLQPSRECPLAGSFCPPGWTKVTDVSGRNRRTVPRRPQNSRGATRGQPSRSSGKPTDCARTVHSFQFFKYTAAPSNTRRSTQRRQFADPVRCL